jgi:DNA-binding CsgD family transcriptional regulator
VDAWPLVGRGEELAVVLEALAAPGAPAVVVAGAAGVGKTRLAREVARRLDGEGWTIRLVVGSEAAASIPFGAVASLVPDASADSPVEMLAAARAALATDEKRTLLVVDDAHRLDAASATLVHQVVTDGVCAVLATVRSGAPSPDAVAALWKDGWARRVELQALGRSEVGALVAAALGGPLDDTTERRLWDASHGNVLYLRELVQSAHAAGRLALVDGLWRLQGQVVAPPSLLELVDVRLAGLDEEAHAALDVLALAESLPLALLGDLAAPGAFERLEADGIVEVRELNGAPTLFLGHPLYGEAARARLPRLRRQRLCGALADAFDRPDIEGPDVLRVVSWRLAAGQTQDSERLLAAARQAFRSYDSELATQLASAAEAAGAGFEAAFLRGEIQFLTGDPAEAEAILARLVDDAETDEQRSRLANARAYNLSNQLARLDEAEAVLASGLASVEDPGARQLIAARLGVLQAHHGRPEDAIETLADVVVDGAAPRAFSTGAYGLTLALAELGRRKACIDAAEYARRVGADATMLRRSLYDLGPLIVTIASGPLAEATDRAARGLDDAIELKDVEGQSTYSVLGGLAAFERGTVGAAGRLFRQATGLNRSIDDRSALRWSIAGTAMAAAVEGTARTDEIVTMLDEADALTDTRAPFFELLLVERAHAWVAVAGGEHSRALAVLGSAADAAAASGHPVAELVLRHDRARLGGAAAAAAEADRMAELAGLVEGELPVARAAHTEAIRRNDADALAVCVDAFHRLGASGLAADAARDAANTYRASGANRRAAAMEEAARREQAIADAGRLPRHGAVDSPTPLTPRELEIALLASQGIASKEIAARLYLSRRTVDNHLQRIYVKLGVTSRGDLRAALANSRQ